MSRSVTDVLGDLQSGRTVEELGAALGLLVEAVVSTGKQGTLTLRLKVKANGSAGVIVSDSIVTSVPAAARAETVFFATSGGSLVRSDPRQGEMALRQVAGAVPRAAAE